jgi:enoyl-CoA hydratase/carnithine racemase
MRELPWYVDTPPIRRWIDRVLQEGREDEAERRVAAWTDMVESHGVVETSIEGRVGVVTLSFPGKGNALVPPMYRMLVKAMEKLSLDDEVWVVVITGKGKNFSSGGYVGDDAFYAGLDAGKEGTTPEPMRRTFVEMFQPVPLAVYGCEKPVIVALNGPVMAESVDIALAGDLRVGHAGSDFWFSFAKTGNTAYTGAAWSLPRLIGVSRASELLLSGGRIDGETGARYGLINHLVNEDEFEARYMQIAKEIASLPPITLRLIKKEIRAGLNLSSYASALDVFSMIEPHVQFTEDHMDAEQAVIEKRPPVVRGR